MNQVDGMPVVTDAERYPDGGQWLRVTATAPGWDTELGREALRTSVELIGPREGEERDTLWQVTLVGGRPTGEQVAAAARRAVAEYGRHGDSYTGACSTRVFVDPRDVTAEQLKVLWHQGGAFVRHGLPDITQADVKAEARPLEPADDAEWVSLACRLNERYAGWARPGVEQLGYTYDTSGRMVEITPGRLVGQA